MVGANFMDEMDCGSFFDHIDDLLEFPNDDVENVLVGKGSGCDEFSLLWPENSFDSELPGSECVFSGANNCASNLSAELSVPYEDIIHLEWLSTFVEDSFSGGGLTLEKSQSSSSTTTTQSQSFQNQFQSSSPISILESSSNCTTTNNNINNRKRARSKRPRSTAFTPRLAILVTSSESESSLHPHKKKQKIKFLPPLNNQNQNPNPPSHSQAVRKCMHCEITKTPQWRAGPMGPKTLCNACGVRYKSGRLFPEYRPAASPTFVPALHSNSHKKVVEMRSKNNGDNSEMPM